MQPIQDKDIDKIFKDAFEHAEIAPSKDFWANIENKIDRKRGRSLPIIWLAAAAVLVVSAVGVFMYQENIEVPTQFVKQQNTISEKPILDKDQIAVPSSAIVAEKKIGVWPSSTLRLSSLVEKKLKRPTNHEEVETQVVLITNASPDNQKRTLAGLEVAKKELNTKIQEIILPKEEEYVLVALPSVKKEDEVGVEGQEIERKGIRSVGDLLNLVVNKVDKRKNKLIQFKTDEGDDSSITSMNFGPLKFGHRDK